ncbi:cilia- and flagella-associated protein 107-like [Babylonia areolata]|uniref:cilia- and flagella-associated protein 107-like n=1 Tax=Babylonia areolata TaxID=304850 RepID=UPI003FCFE0FE
MEKSKFENEYSVGRSKIQPGHSTIPGWRIEQEFNPGVLIGNWNEENRNFIKENHKHDSMYRTMYRNYGLVKPDVIVRRRAEQHNTGMPPELFLNHHGNKYMHNMVTWYDEDYNGRWREKGLPPRHYDRHSMKWLPEKSDHCVQEPPTNFGLLPLLQKYWAAQAADLERGDYMSTYTVSYGPYIPLPRHTRNAQPVFESTTLHPVNKTLKDLHLRNTPLLKSPEQLPAEMSYVSC